MLSWQNLQIEFDWPQSFDEPSNRFHLDVYRSFNSWAYCIFKSYQTWDTNPLWDTLSWVAEGKLFVQVTQSCWAKVTYQNSIFPEHPRMLQICASDRALDTAVPVTSITVFHSFSWWIVQWSLVHSTITMTYLKRFIPFLLISRSI